MLAVTARAEYRQINAFECAVAQQNAVVYLEECKELVYNVYEGALPQALETLQNQQI